MSALLVDLLPELIGLIITPAAVIGCVLLLQAERGVVKAILFGCGFLVQYLIIAVAALIGGAAQPDAQNDDVKVAVGIGAGALLLLLGVVQLLHRPAPDAPAPRWIGELDKAGPTAAFVIGVVMAIVNPNLLILLSGLSVISTANVSAVESLIGTFALFVAALLDFLVPIGLYVLLGDRARAGLARTKTWMLANNRVLSLVVLFAFGAIFLVRGLRALG